MAKELEFDSDNRADKQTRATENNHIPQNPPVSIYHERQSRQLCALHALNNLFQSPNAFKKQDLDTICKELAPTSWLINPHRSTFGLGCYDVNVIIAALARKGYDVVWFDKRKDISCLDFANIYGLILNVPNMPSFGLLSGPIAYIPRQAQVWSSQKHWITIRKIGPVYYHLDPKLEAPICIGDTNDLVQYLDCENSSQQVEILIVVSKSVSESKGWLKKP